MSAPDGRALLLTGAVGVGKTTTADAVAAELSGSPADGARAVLAAVGL